MSSLGSPKLTITKITDNQVYFKSDFCDSLQNQTIAKGQMILENADGISTGDTGVMYYEPYFGYDRKIILGTKSYFKTSTESYNVTRYSVEAYSIYKARMFSRMGNYRSRMKFKAWLMCPKRYHAIVD